MDNRANQFNPDVDDARRPFFEVGRYSEQTGLRSLANRDQRPYRHDPARKKRPGILKREVRVGTWRSLDLAGGEQTATELAVVDAPDDLRQAALGHGIYMAGIHDEQFVMETPAGFISKSWVS